jgi:ATP-binding cassette subfamily B protein
MTRTSEIQRPKIDTVKQTIALYYAASMRHKTDFLMAGLLPIGGIFTNVGMPFFAGRALAAISIHNGQFLHHLWYVIIVIVVGITFNRIGFLRLMALQAKVMSELSQNVFDRLMSRGTQYHANQIGGKLVSDALDFVGSYSTLVNTVVVTGLSFMLTLIFGMIIVMIQSWQLGIFLAVAVTICMAWTFGNTKVRSRLRSNRLIATKKLISHIADTVVNVQTVKIFAAEQKELAQNKQNNEELKALRLVDWQSAGRSGNNRTGFLLVTIIFLLLLINHIAKTNPAVLATSIFAFTYTFTLLVRLFDLNAVTRIIEESFLNASPMTVMLGQNLEVKDAQNAVELAATSGHIEFTNVVFHYADSDQQTVFNGLTITIKPGEKVGLVGPSGGGKSTLTRLLLRFEDIQSGHITIDGQDIAKVTQRSLRQAISYVPQEPLLFHRSVAENIGYGKDNTTPADIQHAAKLAHADEFIQALPNQYQTIVGERGIKLSGGQRQRVAIARAIVKDAPILLLDEATSALDSESEALIQESLYELMQNKTAIVIAHRLSTIQKMDRILVLHDGKIVEQGSHAQLIKNKKGLYYKLWKHQVGGFLSEE